MADTRFNPPPTYADPVDSYTDPLTGQPKGRFNPIWLKWFLELAAIFDADGRAPPKAHATSHESGGSDSIKLDNLSAPDDNTDLDVSTTLHGLVPKAVAPSSNLKVLGIANGETSTTWKQLGDAAEKSVGTSAGTVAAGDDGRFLSSAQKTDLTDSGDSTLHYHASDRDRANHTGTQTLSTISDAGTAAGESGLSATVTLAKITAGGSDGSLTFTNGVLTSKVDPT